MFHFILEYVCTQKLFACDKHIRNMFSSGESFLYQYLGCSRERVISNETFPFPSSLVNNFHGSKRCHTLLPLVRFPTYVI